MAEFPGHRVGDDTQPLGLVLRHAQDGASAGFATPALVTEAGRLEVTAAIGVPAEHDQCG